MPDWLAGEVVFCEKPETPFFVTSAVDGGIYQASLALGVV